jgi:hypothetical protein
LALQSARIRNPKERADVHMAMNQFRTVRTPAREREMWHRPVQTGQESRLMLIGIPNAFTEVRLLTRLFLTSLRRTLPMNPTFRRYLFVLSASGAIAFTLGCGGDNSSAPSAGPKATPARAKETASGAKEEALATGWGPIKGRVVFGGAKLPEAKNLEVNKDTEHCLSRGPIPSEYWVVNPENRGTRWAVVFLKPARGKKLAIHDSLKEPNPRDIVLDQPACKFEPHVLGMRRGQRLVAKNPAPVAHNIQVQGISNSFNVTLPPGSSHAFEFEPEFGALKMSCSVHPWMQAFTWVFDHPYYAVTDADGRFEIKLAPAGSQSLIVWQEAVNYVPDAKGRTIEVKPDAVLDLGEIIVKPAE